MIKNLLRITACLLGLSLVVTDLSGQITQTPKGILFQASITDSKGNSASGRTVYIEDAIIQKTPNGTVVYSETFQIKASEQGLISIVIGQGTRVSGAASIADIDWSAGPYYFNVKTAVAPPITVIGWVPSQNYVNLGTSPFWAVPYAMFAANVQGMDKKLNVSDTSLMLKPYRENKNVVFTPVVNGLVPAPGKVQGRYLSDNGTWLPFIDTVLLNNKIKAKLAISDTISMLSGYAKSGQSVRYADTTSLLGGYALRGQSVKYADTTSMLTGYARSGQFVKYADTATMLSNRLRISDTTSMLSGYALLGQSVKYADTTLMLSGYAKSGQSVRYADTASMLSNRLRISQTGRI